MGRSRSRLVRLSLRLRRVWDGDGDCVYRMGAFDCLPAILRLPGNTLAVNAGRHAVGSRSGSIVSPLASYPLRLCILSPVSRPVAPCRIIPCRLIRAVICLLRHHSLPFVSVDVMALSLFTKCVEFDACELSQVGALGFRGRPIGFVPA